MECLQTRGAPTVNRRRLLEKSAPWEVPLFPLPEVDDAPVIDSFSQSAYKLPVLHDRPTVRFPWPKEDIDLSNITTQLPVNMVVQSSGLRTTDGIEGVAGYGDDLFDLLTDLPISVSETLVDPAEDLLSFSDFSSTQVNEQSTDEALGAANKQATSQLKDYSDQDKDARIPKAKILQLPGEVLNIVFEHLTEPADYEIKWLKRGSYLTYWRYRVPRASLDKHTQHSACKRIRKPNGGESCWDWRADHHWDPIFTRQWQKSSVSLENTVPRRAKFRAGYRRFGMTSASVDPDTGTPTELDYVGGDTAWLMVCRRFYEAGTSLFYSNKTFSISGHHLFEKFLSNLTPHVRPWLRHIYLYHEAPGEPKSRTDVRFRDKDNTRWIETCKNGAALLSGTSPLIIPPTALTQSRPRNTRSLHHPEAMPTISGNERAMDRRTARMGDLAIVAGLRSVHPRGPHRDRQEPAELAHDQAPHPARRAGRRAVETCGG
jgi:hypothetical protein